MDCLNCGTNCPEGSKFCNDCGAPQHKPCPTCQQPQLVGANFCGNCGKPLKPAALNCAPKEAERRQIAVMFCDLVDSMQIASKLDPDDLAELLSAFQAVAANCVSQFGGHVARYMGDGVLVYFGWPQADEAYTERAVSAGLALVTAVGRLPAFGFKLEARVGIATGLVVVGDSFDAGSAKETAVAGETPNLAARLQHCAEPNTLVISQSTKDLVGNMFDCVELNALELKGIQGPVKAWKVRGRGQLESRFQALHGQRLTKLIGREEEIELLMRRWTQIKRGEGRIMLIAADAGVGKSRLVVEFEQRLAGEDHAVLHYYCAPHQQNSVLYPVKTQIEFQAGFAPHDSIEDKLQKLRAHMRNSDLSEMEFALIGNLLSLPATSLPALILSPQRKKERTFDALSRQLTRIARKKPVLIILEDAHWCDPSTLELLDLILDRVTELPILFIMTYRPELHARWAGRPGVTSLIIARFDKRQSRAMIAQLVDPANPLELGFIDRIVNGSDGVPLYIEELTKNALEQRRLSAPSAGESVQPSVPASLQASLLERLDRHPAAKEVAQIGAVIGREFSSALLSAVAKMPEPVLAHGLEQLIASELIFRRGYGPDAIYIFKHALLQEMAYGTLVRARRNTLHSRVTCELVRHFPNIDETQPGLLAHHCAQAGMIEEAATYYRRAGEQSAERAALAETLGHLQQGLSLVRGLPDTPDRRMLEVELKLAHGRVLLSTIGNADLAAGKIFEEAVALSRDLDHPELLTRALWGYWFNMAHRMQLEKASLIAEEYGELSQRQGNVTSRHVASVMQGISRYWQGRFHDARDHLGTARELARADNQTPIDLAVVADNLNFHAGMQYSLALGCLGQFDQARTEAAAAVEGVKSCSHLPSRAIVLAAKCRHDFLMRDEVSARISAAALIALAEEQNFPFYLAHGQCHQGWLDAKAGNLVRGHDCLRRGLKGLRDTQAIIWEPYARALLGEALGWAGMVEEAHEVLDEALRLSNETGGTWFVAELHRLKAAIYLTGEKIDERAAEHQFSRAIIIAESQSAKHWELRAKTGLSGLYARQGRRREARKLLQPIRACFPNNVEHLDVQDASALLAQLG